MIGAMAAPLQTRRAPVPWALTHRSAGNALPDKVRHRMESVFAHDFSHVRVHADQAAAKSAAAAHAAAYTIGSEIVFGAGRYRPDTTAGLELVAHELAHAIQQRPAVPTSDSSSNLEREATAAAAAVREGRTPTVRGRSGIGVARQPIDAGVPEAPVSIRRGEHVECVRRLGGCPNTRDAGIPSPEEIAAYNETCRGESGYDGPDVTPSDEECVQGVSTAPPAPTTPFQVCSRELSFTSLANHAYVRAREKQYAIISPLCPAHWYDSPVVTGTGGQKWDNSPDPCHKTPTCLDCLPAPGVTDVGACLDAAFRAYNNPSEYHLTGPNSNTFAGTLARRCCAGMVPKPPALGLVPGWDDAPAGPRPTPPGGCPPGPTC